MESGGIPFSKGHGTGNDFVILPDPDGELDLTPRRVRALCDRRFGIGGDGVLRVVRTGAAGVAEEFGAGSSWFMDYRNGDGSLAQMCGNGARVFARYLVRRGWAEPEGFLIGTRGGPRRVVPGTAGRAVVEMGPVTVSPADSAVVNLGHTGWSATPAHAPNPHAVVFVDDLAALGDIEASTVGTAETFPEGANIEFVQVIARDRVRMRVHERGSGETLSCGTGACAVVAVHIDHHIGVPDEVFVEVPGGELLVRVNEGRAVLIGPAELVADGTIDRQWWESL